MAKIVRLTEDGLKKLVDELEYLKTQGRSDIAERIKIARGYGDLSENSEYDDAKNEQAKIEARIAEIESIIKNHVIITDDEINGDVVTVGVDVEIKLSGAKSSVTYHMVGSAEADPLNFKISDESPVGKALMGQKVGDKVRVETPGGEVTYKIISIKK